MGFFTALRFLTILPAPFGRDASPRAYGESLPYFPLVGLVLGIILAGLYLLLQLVMPPPLVAGLLVIALLLLSGAHHLDGLIDTADSFGGASAAARLETAKASVAGGRGAVAAALLLLKFAALSSLGYWPALLIAPAVSRWLMVNALYIFPAARRNGFGAEFKRGVTLRRFLAATAITIAVTLLVMGLWPGLIILASAWVLSTGLGWYLSRRLGGLNGDGCGAIGEVAEALVLVAAVSVW